MTKNSYTEHLRFRVNYYLNEVKLYFSMSKIICLIILLILKSFLINMNFRGLSYFTSVKTQAWSLKNYSCAPEWYSILPRLFSNIKLAFPWRFTCTYPDLYVFLVGGMLVCFEDTLKGRMGRPGCITPKLPT